ncbi:DUF4870 domain-containing protein [Opitutus sp. ER46]|nr:DUF4870 domain-containing protein [Opitutus sp. ER46]
MDSAPQPNPAPVPPPAASTPLPPPIPVSRPSGHDKVWAILSHVSAFFGVPILLPLIVYLAMKDDSPYIAENAKEALNFHISLLLYSIVAGLLVFVVIGIPLLVAIYLGGLVLAIIAAVKASDGGCYRYPLTIRLVK